MATYLKIYFIKRENLHTIPHSNSIYKLDAYLIKF